MLQSKFGAVAALAVSLLATLVTSEAADQPPSGLVAPRFTIRYGDRYANLAPSEGWVVLSFTVSRSATITDIQVLDSVGDKALVDLAKRTLKEMRFKAARLNNTPVDWHNYQFTYKFLAPKAKLPSDEAEFESAYQHARALLDAGDYAKAKTKIDQLLIANTWVVRYIKLQSSLFTALRGLGAHEAARRAILRATMYLRAGPGPWNPKTYPIGDTYDVLVRQADPNLPVQLAHGDRFTPNALLDALEVRFKFEFATNRVGEAQSTLELIEEMRPSASDAVNQAREMIDEATSSIEPILVHGHIADRSWDYVPLRRVLKFRDVSGQIDEVDLLCNAGDARVPYMPNLSVKIPVDLGRCEVYVVGQNGTEFEIVESTSSVTPNNGQSENLSVPPLRSDALAGPISSRVRAGDLDSRPTPPQFWNAN